MVILFFNFVSHAYERILSQFAFTFKLYDLLHIFWNFLALATPADGVAIRLFTELSVRIKFFTHFLILLLTQLVALFMLPKCLLAGLKI